MVNILIAIVTGEYAKAQESSATLFARARLETAARQGENNLHREQCMQCSTLYCPSSNSYYLASCKREVFEPKGRPDVRERANLLASIRKDQEPCNACCVRVLSHPISVRLLKVAHRWNN